MLSSLNWVIFFFSARPHTHAEQTSQEIKKEVEQQLKDKELLDHSLPSSIVIGPFIVRVEDVRNALSKKRKALAHAILDQLVLKLRKQVSDVSHLFLGQMTLHNHVIHLFCFYTGPIFTSAN